MPFYDLKCTKCGNEFNIMASMNEKRTKSIKCPNCQSNELETIFKNINIVKTKKNNPSCSGGCCGCPHS